jgi:hypothetical protein
VSNFKISRDETLDNKPIVIVRKRVKTHLRQCIISEFSGEGPPLEGEGNGGEKSGREQRGGDGKDRDIGTEEWSGREGLKERGEKGGREGERKLDPQCSRQIDDTVYGGVDPLNRLSSFLQTTWPRRHY